MSKKALVILAEGFEEIEAITPVDILRRAEVDVTVAGLGAGSITGAHGVTVKADIVFENVDFLPDAMILPGGTPGTGNLAKSEKVKDMAVKMNSEGRLVAAICASPALVLAPAGILSGRSATCYPTLETNFPPDAKYIKENVVRDGNIITSQGPATAFAFGVKIAEALAGKDKANTVAGQMLFGV